MFSFQGRETFMETKSRILWLKKRDKNIKFFHANTKHQRARNRIVCPKDRNGKWVESEAEIEKMTTQYFQELFTSSHPSNPEESLRYIIAKVPESTNGSLIIDPSEEEIKAVFFYINPDKTPESDRMTSRLYQRFWQTMNQEIIKLVRNFSQRGASTQDSIKQISV